MVGVSVGDVQLGALGPFPGPQLRVRATTADHRVHAGGAASHGALGEDRSLGGPVEVDPLDSKSLPMPPPYVKRY